jgi:hypothetical protein
MNSMLYFFIINLSNLIFPELENHGVHFFHVGSFFQALYTATSEM